MDGRTSTEDSRVLGDAAAPLTKALRNFGDGSWQEMASLTGCSERSARRFRTGHALPDTLGMARLMRFSNEVAAAFLRMAGLDDVSLQRDAARLKEELARWKARRAGVPDDAIVAATDADQGGDVPDLGEDC